MYTVRFANNEDLSAIEQIAYRNKDSLGFILRCIIKASTEAGELFVACKEDGEVIGFIRWHRRRDGWIIIYEICVRRDFRGEGVGRLLLEKVPKPIRLKCPQDNESNKFYEHLGFTLAGQEAGRKRALNIWIHFE